MELVDVIPYIAPGSAVGAAAAFIIYLLKRGERKDEGAYERLLAVLREMKEQRDYWRERAEECERHRNE